MHGALCLMSRLYSFYYSVLLGVLGWLSSWPVWLRLPPCSIHQWRQADGAALCWQYAQYPDFWSPTVQNLFYAGDAHAVGEFPLLYWLSGLVTRDLGWPDYPLRWIGLAWMVLGGWAFGWMVLQAYRHTVFAALCGVLLLSAPIFCYYGPGFLPDAPAFSMLLIMGACLWQADATQKKSWLIAAAGAAALAVLLKISMAVLPLALILAWAREKSRKTWTNAELWGSWWPWICLAGIALLVGSFRYWVAEYNDRHGTAYFLQATRPIWNYNGAFIGETLQLIARHELPAMASAGLYLACAGCLYLMVRFWQSVPAFWRNTLLLIGAGSLFYGLLWFRMLREHDYYYFCLLILPAFLFLLGLRLATQIFSEKFLLTIMGACLLIGFVHTHYFMHHRLELAFHPENSLYLPPDAFLAARELSDAGIPDTARFICPEDPSPNIALLALKRPGWTLYNFGDRINADTLMKYQSTQKLTHLALRDTAAYAPLYRQFFPKSVWTGSGWNIYAR